MVAKRWLVYTKVEGQTRGKFDRVIFLRRQRRREYIADPTAAYRFKTLVAARRACTEGDLVCVYQGRFTANLVP